jgi:DNA-binding HxlR family transcriptional regulator
MAMTIDPTELVPAGALTALDLLGAERTEPVLRSLLDGALQPTQIETILPQYAHATLLETLKRQQSAGSLTRERLPHATRYELTAPGAALLGVADVLGAWAGRFDGTGRQELPTWQMTRALHVGWEAGILQLLSDGALRRPEIGSRLPLSHDRLQGRLGALRQAGLLETIGQGRGAEHGVARFGRQAMGAVIAAAEWQHLHRDGGRSWRGGPVHVSTALVVAAPLLALSPRRNGTAIVTVSSGYADEPPAGFALHLAHGAFAGAGPARQATPTAWLHGSPDGWSAAVTRTGAIDELEVTGDASFASELIDQLHGALGLT